MTASVWSPSNAGVVLSNLARVYQEFNAGLGQTNFALATAPYTVGANNLEVFKNGLKLLPSLVTEVAGGASFVIGACAPGDKIEAVVFPGTSNSFTQLAAESAASAAASLLSASDAAASAALAATFSTGWQTANNTFSGANQFIQSLLCSAGIVTTSLIATELNGGQLAGLRNKIINGDMRVFQRGTISVAGYFLDRWQIETFGTGAAGTYATRGDSMGTVLEPYGAYSLAIGRTAGTSLLRISQRIEDARTLSGKTVTLSFVGMVTAGALPIYPRLDQSFGTGGSPSADVSTSLSSLTLSTTPTLFTTTVTLPTTTGKTFGSNGNSYLSLIIDSPAAGAFDIRIVNVQLEAGSVATPFETRPYGLELALCQRYLPVIASGSYLPGMCTAATTALGLFNFPVTPRAVPTGMTLGAAANTYSAALSSGSPAYGTALVFTAATLTGAIMLLSGAGGLVAGAGTLLALGGVIKFDGCEL